MGQGYVGREVSLAATASGHTVFGIDTNEQALEAIKEYQTSTLYDYIRYAGIVVVCLPTPSESQDLILDGIDKVFEHISPGALLIIESTVPVGFTAMISEKYKQHDVMIAYSPERIDPGNKDYDITNTPKIVAGATTSAREVAMQFYSTFCMEVVPAYSLEEAEAAKLLENAFRLINISFVNEMSKYLYNINVYAPAVIELAATKPYGFMRFGPGIGAGGHCIPVDPVFLIDSATEVGSSIKTLEIARAVNLEMANFFHNVARDKIGNLEGKNICVVGISYKPNTKDTRESRSLELIKLLRDSGANVVWHDEVVKQYVGEESQPLTNDYDLVIITNRHNTLDESLLVDKTILDCERLS